jgi:hypothetical protein
MIHCFPFGKGLSNSKFGTIRLADSLLSFNYLTQIEQKFKFQFNLKDADNPVDQYESSSSYDKTKGKAQFCKNSESKHACDEVFSSQ